MPTKAAKSGARERATRTQPVAPAVTQPTPAPNPHVLAQRQVLIDDMHRELGYAPPFLPAMLTEKEIARVLKKSVSTLQTRRWAGNPMPAHTRIGKTVMYRAADVADFILSHTIGASI